MTKLINNQILIYSAGKTWHADLFREMRDDLGYSVVASWIDFDCAVFDLPEQHRSSMWHHMSLDARRADVMIIYCGDEAEEQGGALVEIGKFLIQSKPVYVIGTCASFKPIPTSDRAFTRDELFHFTVANTIRAGYREALAHYKVNHAHRWEANREGVTLPLAQPSMSAEEIAAVGTRLKQATA